MTTTEEKCPNPNCEDGMIRGTVVGCGICQSAPRPRRKAGSELTREQTLRCLHRLGERLTGLVEHKAPEVLLLNEVALACKHIHRLRELSGGPHEDIDDMLVEIYQTRWLPLHAPAPAAE